MINNKKIGSTKKEVKVFLKNRGERNIVGGSGAFGLLGGANIVSAGRQILKSGLGRGAINIVKSIFKKKAPKTVFKSKPVEFMGPNPANKIGAGKNSYPR